MKLFIPFSQKDIGGISTFVAKFSDQFAKQGVEIGFQFQRDFDIIFIVTDCSLLFPLYAKIKGKKIVQRLDGVYHPATPAGRWYWLYNLKMKLIYNFFADTVIYQSKFSKLSCEKFLGKTRAKKTAIIYNGVDLDVIPNKKDCTPHSPIKLITFAKFRRRDQIEPIIESVKLLDPEQYSLDIYGSYTNNLNHLFDSLPSHIRFQGKKSNKDLLQILHQYDIFLFSDQSACPNSVLEAMAAGLPVVAFDRGSIPELIKSGYNGLVISLKENQGYFLNSYPFRREDFLFFSESIAKVGFDIASHSKNAFLRVHTDFSLSKMSKEYSRLIQD